VFSKEAFIKIEKYLPLQRKKAIINNYVLLRPSFTQLKTVTNSVHCLKSMKNGTQFTCDLDDKVKTGVYNAFLKHYKRRA
jgi:hypothetical protein